MKKTFSTILLALLAIVAYTQGQLPQNKMPVLGNYNYSDSVQIGVLSLDSNLSGVGTFLKIDTITGLVSRDTIPDAISSDSVLNLVRANVDTSGTLNLQQVTDNDSTTDNKITITNSLEQGSSTTASGDFSHAEGFNTTSSGAISHAEGQSSTAVGAFSHAEGGSTTSTGNYSHSEGLFTEAHSYVEKSQGTFTTTYTPNSTGSFSPTDRLWAIGNGANISNRNNALTMLKNGTTTIDTTWSYDASMSPYSFSGLEIPHAEWVQNNIPSISGIYSGSGSTPSTQVDVTNNGGVFFADSAFPTRGVTIHTDETTPTPTDLEHGLEFFEPGESVSMGFHSTGGGVFQIKSNFAGGGGQGVEVVANANILLDVTNHSLFFMNLSGSGFTGGKSGFIDRRTAGSKTGLIYGGFGENSLGEDGDYSDLIDASLAPKAITLKTDTFRFDSTQLVGLGTGEDTLLTTTTGKFIDVISLSLVSIGGTGYTFAGDIVIKSENGTISTPATTILTSAGPLFRKSSIQDDAELGEHVIFDIQGSGATGGNKNLAIVVHYKIITI